MGKLNKIRGFEIVTPYLQKVELPKRSTMQSAGYDFGAAETVEVPTIWQQVGDLAGAHEIADMIAEADIEVVIEKVKPTMIPTGIKAYMQPGEFLAMPERSSLFKKTNLKLSNGIGIIDADYYNNPENEGHIFIGVYNLGAAPFTVEKGMKLTQGIFMPYLLADEDNAGGERLGGIGSTGGY